MKCVDYRNLTTYQKDQFFLFLMKAYSEKNNPAHVNMYDVNWETNVNTLPYILEKTNRFDKGSFTVLFDDQRVAACSGVYESEFCPELAIAGNRTWIDIDYRNKSVSRDFLLRNEKAWALQNNYKAIALTFNSYNKNLIKIWQKRRLGEKRTPRQPYHMFHRNFNSVDYLVYIQYTPQYIIYETLDDSFAYDWNQIRYVGQS